MNICDIVLFKKNLFDVFKNNDNKCVNFIKKENLILIRINRDCDFNEYLNSFRNGSDIFDSISIPTRMYITDSCDISKNKLKRQLIWFEKINNGWVIMSKSDTDYKMSLFEITDDFIDEINLEINAKKYKISKFIHDLNFNTKFVKWYPIDNLDISTYFSLNENEAVYYTNNLINKLKSMKIVNDYDIDYIKSVININDVFDIDEVKDKESNKSLIIKK